MMLMLAFLWQIIIETKQEQGNSLLNNNANSDVYKSRAAVYEVKQIYKIEVHYAASAFR